MKIDIKKKENVLVVLSCLCAIGAAPLFIFAPYFWGGLSLGIAFVAFFIRLLWAKEAAMNKAQRVVYVSMRWIIFGAVMALAPIAAKAMDALTLKDTKWDWEILIGHGELLIICAVMGMSAIGNVFVMSMKKQRQDKQPIEPDTDEIKPSFIADLAPMVLVGLCMAVTLFSSIWYMKIDSFASAPDKIASSQIVVGSLVLFISSSVLGVFTSLYGEFVK
jgi:hypothetical protein